MKKLLSFVNDTGTEHEFILNELNDFCKNKINSTKCQNFYNSLSGKSDGIYSCPFNFNCIKRNGKIYNCLLIKDNYNHAKVKFKKSDKQQVFEQDKVINLIEIDEQSEINFQNCEAFDNNISDFLHDITKVNKLIENNSKNISKDNLSRIDKSRFQSILHLSDFITKRINLYRYISNPNLISVGRARERSGYKLWDIYRYIFSEIGKDKKISVDMKIYDKNLNEVQDAETRFYASDSITILPFLLIDNAIKYSRENSTIKVSFIQDNGMLEKIIVCSKPSYVINENPNVFFNRGYRSPHNTSKSSGSGLGLNIVKQICDYNNIHIDLDVGPDEDGKQEFFVNMSFSMEADSND